MKLILVGVIVVAGLVASSLALPYKQKANAQLWNMMKKLAQQQLLKNIKAGEHLW